MTLLCPPRFLATLAALAGGLISTGAQAALKEGDVAPAFTARASQAGKVSVASDADGKIARSYELTVRDATPDRKDTRGVAIGHGFAERTTFIVRPDGRIAATVGGVSPVENVDKALAVVRELASAGR